MTERTSTSTWKALTEHAKIIQKTHMRDFFAADPGRFDAFSVQDCGILFDYSKNRVTEETLRLLLDLARQSDVEGWRTRMFEGAEINKTEGRAVLHTALRAPADATIMVAGENVIPKVHAVRERMRLLVEAIHRGARGGATGKPITDVVTIGIGGSLLGPEMAVKALSPSAQSKLNMHFISGLDPVLLDDALDGLSWETTLFIIGSKSFSTKETMIHAEGVRSWFRRQAPGETGMENHFIAVTAQADKARDFGIAAENIFEMWDWVGGRYSLWSAIGLPIALAIGMDGFEAFLGGAHEMDQHFLNTPMERNMPVIMALLGVWYINFLGAQAQAIVPYTHLLRHFPRYLQQLDMESNGKRVTLDGTEISHATAPVIWGEVGTSAQHSFFQRLHQGPEFVPVDFIASVKPGMAVNAPNTALLSNCLAQSEVLMQGKAEPDVRAEMAAAGETDEQIDFLAPHRTFPGNRPSNTLLLRHIDPKTLGALIALYEHKVFVQGVLWNIDSFDQWGVELGKSVARDIAQALDGKAPAKTFDSSTEGLVKTARGLNPIKG